MKAFLKPVCADKEMLLATFYQELLTQLQKVEMHLIAQEGSCMA